MKFKDINSLRKILGLKKRIIFVETALLFLTQFDSLSSLRAGGCPIDLEQDLNTHTPNHHVSTNAEAPSTKSIK